jgi:hypothetical protein
MTAIISFMAFLPGDMTKPAPEDPARVIFGQIIDRWSKI